MSQTLNYSNIENHGDFDVNSASFSDGTAMGAPTAYHNDDNKNSTTKSAIANGNLTVRNKDAQKQAVDTLSHDTANANSQLQAFFDKDKEQDRMDTVQMVKDVATQVKTVGTKLDRLTAQKEVDKKGISEDAYNAAKNTLGANATEKQIKALAYSNAVDTAVIDATKNGNNIAGIGSGFNKAVDSGASLVTGAITGDVIGGLAGASAPYLAGVIKNSTPEDSVERYVAHGILGGGVAALQGNSALAGAVGAAGGEYAANTIRDNFYDGKDTKDLTESEKENISNWSQIASGAAAFAGSGGNMGDASTAMSASKNAVENNLLSPADVAEADKKYAACNGERKCQMQVVKETNELDKEKTRALQEYKNQLLEEYAEKYRKIVADCEGNTTCQIERRDWLQKELDNRYRDFYTKVTDGASSDDLSFGYYPDDTKIQALWEGMKNAPDKLVDGIIEGGDKAIRYIDDNSLGKIGDDAWEFGKQIASIPAEWLNKEIPADSFETALTELGSMTARDVGEASFDTVADVATVYLGGKTIQWVSGKWIKVNGITKPVTKAETGIKWGEGIKGQGMPWEDFVGKELPAGSRLPVNFKTFDYYDLNTGKAISVKTLDTLTDAKLANPKQIYSTLKGNIDAAANFDQYILKGKQLSSSDIIGKEIRLAIPAATNKIQWEQIYKAIDYGKSQGVKVIVTEVK